MSKPNRKVVRLQQMRAQRAQAAKTQFVDIYFENENGVEEVCTLPTQDDWPVEVIEEVQEKGGDANIGLLRELALPPESFDRLVKVGRLTVGELKEIVEALADEAGTTEGEGSGSSTSSTSTPGASEPTSSATTPAAA
ncbi:hypothetical protein KVH30_02400 [Streptomyces olivaceus]|uniref:hypothetical protein n=1 Tax=Streptomyces olivaceus TaxID=47716 RepID=UPI001CCF3DFA|nr:hypothetical protein [Streptomyces olivaceus]MBZ6290424.1 hypothetical protein [Streptomyces olivaceus]MBZ6324376.1 hypothetical protein [Streptomyces olivaceus]